MLDTKTRAIPLSSTVFEEPVMLVTQYGCGLNPFAGRYYALPERRLVFENVIHPTAPGPQSAILNVAGSANLSSDHKIAEYQAGILKVEPCPVP